MGSEELVRWRNPLDEDYSYGYIVETQRKYVVVRGTGYYNGSLALVHMKYIEQRGGDTDEWSKKYSK